MNPCDDKEITEISIASRGNDDRNAAKENMQMVIYDEEIIEKKNKKRKQ